VSRDESVGLVQCHVTRVVGLDQCHVTRVVGLAQCKVCNKLVEACGRCLWMDYSKLPKMIKQHIDTSDRSLSLLPPPHSLGRLGLPLPSLWLSSRRS
jgi:hypothetical protein